MKSAVQVLVGASLLSAAFFVCSRWQQLPNQSAKTAEELQNEDLVWHSLESAPPPLTPNQGAHTGQPNRVEPASQNQRTRNQGPGPMLPPDNLISRKPPVAPETSDPIVMPDFKTLEPSNSALASPTLELSTQAIPPDSDKVAALHSSKPHDPYKTQLQPMPEIGPRGPSSDDRQSSTSIAAVSRLSPIRLMPDQELKLETDEFRVYVTRSGDTLQRIAENQMGSAKYYLDIYMANQDSLSSPIEVPVGIPLKIPVYKLP